MQKFCQFNFLLQTQRMNGRLIFRIPCSKGRNRIKFLFNPFLERWLSGRRHVPAKDAYSLKGTEGSNPSLSERSEEKSDTPLGLSRRGFEVSALYARTGPFRGNPSLSELFSILFRFECGLHIHVGDEVPIIPRWPLCA